MSPIPGLQRLREAGVSIWLDTMSRELLDIGEFAELIRDWGITGATSNPTMTTPRRPLRRQPACGSGSPSPT